MIGKALQDYPVYNLTNQASHPPSVVTTAPSKTTQAAGIGTNQINLSNQQDTDSLLFQGMWFMMATTQIDTLANRQEKLEKQMQEQFKTILSELTEICKDMQQYNDQDEYEEYGDIDWPFIPNQMEDIKSTHYMKSLLNGAANNSHMEDVGEQK